MSKSVAIIGTRGYPSYYGGFETAVRKLAPFLVDGGWDVTVYGRKGATKPEDPSRDSRVSSVETWGFENKSLSTLTFGLTSVLHALIAKPDVALVMNVANGFWLPLLKLRGVPSVVNVDGIEWERAKWGKLAKFVFKMGARFTARFATVLISDSVEIQRRWADEFGRESVFIPYGGDVPERLEVLPGLDSGKYVLIVARFVPENTVLEFFNAARNIAVDHPVVIVGTAGYGGALDDTAKNLSDEFPNVTWLGHLSDDQKLMSLWQHAGAYFHGHSVGGTNPALVQAMACGAPVVARRTVYNTEVLGLDDHLVAPEAVAIERAIRNMLADRNVREAASVFNKNRAKERYNWMDVCGNYERTILAAAGISARRQPSSMKSQPASGYDVSDDNVDR